MNKKLYVGNLLYEITDEDLKQLFSQFGNVVSAQVIRYADTGRSKGFGFVEMEDEAGAKAAIDALNQKDYKGRMLVVNEARPPQPKQHFGGGGGGGYKGGGGGHRGGGGYRNNRGGGGGGYGGNQGGSNDDYSN